MGLWIVTDVWIDYQEVQKKNGPVVIRVAMMKLEKVTDDGIWWADSNSGNNPDISNATSVPVYELYEDSDDVTMTMSTPSPPVTVLEICDDCGKAMVPRYSQGLFCGRPECTSSQDRSSCASLGYKERSYLPEFITSRATKEGVPDPPFSYLPEPPRQITKEEFKDLVGNREAATSLVKGYLCSTCMVLNQRVYWNCLECRKCGEILDIKLPHFTFEDLADERFLDLRDADNIPDIRGGTAFPGRQKLNKDRCVGQIFEADGGSKIALILPKRDEIYRQGGVRDMFNRAFDFGQTGRFRLRRFAKKRGDAENDLNYWFGLNLGHDYENKMKMNSLPFSEVPDEMMAIVEYMLDLIDHTLDIRPTYNETLWVGMWPHMSMGWHFDGEESVVGDHVASMSLGGQATMSFGLRDYLMQGHRRGMDPIDIPALPGCLEYDSRRAIKARFDSGELNREEANAEMEKVVKNLRAPREPRADLVIPLPGTGGIVVQYPRRVNSEFVHRVDNGGGVRLVQTSRMLEDVGPAKKNYGRRR
jgi:hypothetical protein